MAYIDQTNDYSVNHDLMISGVTTVFVIGRYDRFSFFEFVLLFREAIDK